MNIAIFVNTPAQVHFYKNIIEKLRSKNHSVYLLARDYGETIAVLKELNLDFFIYSKPPISKIGKIIQLPRNVLNAFFYLKNLKIDMITGFGIWESYTAFLLRIPCITFIDSEPMVNTLWYSLQFKFWIPFMDVLLTPESFRQHLGKKHLKINSFKEFSYLHPQYYKPNNDIFQLLGIKRDEKYALLRFNAFDAVHDSGITGFSIEDKVQLVKDLNKYVKVFISFEGKIAKEIQQFSLETPKNRIHDVLFYATLFVTDAQTMTTEGALLGTPVVRCNQFVGDRDMGNFIELENKFNLIFSFNQPKKAIEKSLDLIQKEGLKEEWARKKSRIYREKIDIASFFTWFLENYPSSSKEFQKNPNLQYNFT